MAQAGSDGGAFRESEIYPQRGIFTRLCFVPLREEISRAEQKLSTPSGIRCRQSRIHGRPLSQWEQFQRSEHGLFLERGGV